jgi:hypothetical protein
MCGKMRKSRSRTRHWLNWLSEKVGVARYGQKTGQDTDGVLVVDTGVVDAVMTSLAVLRHTEIYRTKRISSGSTVHLFGIAILEYSCRGHITGTSLEVRRCLLSYSTGDA